MPALTYGKIFQTMFTGSLCGAGAPVISVMSFVIAFMQPDKDRVEHVRLPVTYLSKVIGEDPKVIQAAIEFLCKADPDSNSPEDNGARLVLESAFTYRVVNGQFYRELKDEEDRRAKAAIRQSRWREKQALERKAHPKFKKPKSLSERQAEKEMGDTGQVNDRPLAEPYQADGNGI